MKYLLSFVFLFALWAAHAQQRAYAVSGIPDSLRANADAVVRLKAIDITISSQRSMTIQTQRVVTVFNEKGRRSIDAMEYYDKSTSVRDIGVVVYDAAGTEIKKIKRRDFRDMAVLDGVTTFSDNRRIFLDYTPTQYPFTIVYESEVYTSNTAFIPAWYPIDNYYTGLERAILDIRFPDGLGFHKKEQSFGPFNIKKTADGPLTVSYELRNVPPLRDEDYAPDSTELFPHLLMGLEQFHLEGVDGSAKNWTDFGKWYSDKILNGTTELPEATTQKIKALVGTETDISKKAAIVYAYLQQKSRYVSIQVGIGGWKPMPAADVDRLGYGDCKALSNYARALLEAVNVPSYPVIIYGDHNRRNIDADFVSMQGNHMILCVPNGNDNIWLECTSQDNPFGYQSRFTDDRNALVVKPDGAEVIKTTVYSDKVNAQRSKGIYELAADGSISGAITIVSEGIQYSNKYFLERLPPQKMEAFYKEYWSNINNLKLLKTEFENDKSLVRFTEKVSIAADHYANPTSGRLVFAVNVYNKSLPDIKRIRNRKTPFEIPRGSYDEDEITITLPSGYAIEALPADFELSGPFGHYKVQILKTDEQHLVYKRSMFLKNGRYASNQYDDYRQYIEQLLRNDNAKIVLVKKT